MEATAQPGSRIRVLVVDDDASVLRTFGRILGSQGARDSAVSNSSEAAQKRADASQLDLVLAHNASEAIREARRAVDNGSPFAICFMDLQMPPGPDGVAAAEQIRQFDKTVLFVIMTGQIEMDPAEILRRIPPPDRLLYQQKPIHDFEMRATIAALTARWRAERQLEATLRGLEAQVDEKTSALRAANAEMRHERNLVGKVMDTTPAGIVVVDRDGRITMINRRAQENLGIKPGDVGVAGPGRPCEILDTWDGVGLDADSHPCARVIRTGQPIVDARVSIRTSADSRLYFFLNAAPLFDEQGKVDSVVVTMEDVTSRRRAEEELVKTLTEAKASAAETTALLDGTRAVLEYKDFPAAARAIFDSCRTLIGASGGYVALLSEDGMHNDVVFLEPGGVPCSVDPDLPMPVRGLREEAYRRKEAIYCNDFAASQWTDLLPPGDSQLANALFAPLILKGESVGLLGLANKLGGFTDEDARMARAFGEIVAIALLNSRTLGSLESSEERFRVLAQTAGDAIVTADQEDRITFWNEAAEATFGYTAAEVVGRDFAFLLPDRVRSRPRATMAKWGEMVGSGRTGRVVEVTGMRRDGTEFPVEISVSTWSTSDRTYRTAVIRDITARKKAERELQAALDRRRELEYIVNRSGFVVFLWRAEEGWPVELVSENVSQFGFRPVDFAHGKMKFADLMHEDDRPRVLAEIEKTVRDGKSDLTQEYRLRTATGEVRWVASEAWVRRDPDGRATHFQGIVSDITGPRSLQAQVVQSQKLEAIGQLAAGIAHEINTPIQYVGDNARFLRDAFNDLNRLLAEYDRLCGTARADPTAPVNLDGLQRIVQDVELEYLQGEVPRAIDQSLEGIERIAKIVRAMKDFSHPGGDEKVPVDLNRAVETTLTVAHNELKYVADVVTEFDSALPLVPCIPNQVNQVVLNILINAVDAISAAVGRESGSKGRITVKTARVGDWAEIRISDTGTGIPEGIRSRIFDPFFTTKEVGRGTGQGLALSHSIVVEKHRGSIAFETELGKGTTFVIRLPLTAGNAPVSA